MKNEKMLFAVAAAILFLGAAVTPAIAVSENALKIGEEKENTVKDPVKSIEDIFILYQDEIQEIKQYLQKYGTMRNLFILRLPKTFQKNIEMIADELRTCILSDGITKIDVKLHWFGWELWLWMSHSYIENNLEPAFNIGTIGVTLLIISLASGGTAVLFTIAWAVAAFLISIGLDHINDIDEGRGVVVYYRYIYFPLALFMPVEQRITPQ